ncbi:MAG TPA: hypothetical protein VIV60_04470, partial [Polyangiaceae bacterium]
VHEVIRFVVVIHGSSGMGGTHELTSLPPRLLLGGGIVELRSTTQTTITAPNSGASSSVGSTSKRIH